MGEFTVASLPTWFAEERFCISANPTTPRTPGGASQHLTPQLWDFLLEVKADSESHF